MTTLSAIDSRRNSLRARLGHAVVVVCLATLTATLAGCGDTADAPADAGMEATAGAAAASATTAGVAGSSDQAEPTATAGVAGSSSEAVTAATPGASDGQQSAASSSEDTSDADGQQSAVSSSEDTSDNAANNQVVSRENPGFIGEGFDDQRSPALIDAPSLDAVQWTVPPTVGAGELVAEGVLQQGVMLFDPQNGEGSAFSVYFKGSREPMVEVLPDLGPMYIWDTDLTVATMDFELEGTSFKLRAYSPLFMDVGSPSQLEFRVFGFDPSGADALLAVRDINAP